MVSGPSLLKGMRDTALTGARPGGYTKLLSLDIAVGSSRGVGRVGIQ